jgi:DNA modification methylase/superfamily II DNA or RNA helicase
MTEYSEFLKTKRLMVQSVGKEVKPDALNATLFPFQRDLVVWACRKGRAAIFADTGLGKTRISLEIARLLELKTLIVAPLSVAKQTIREGEKIGVAVVYSNDGIAASTITITNYEHVHKFDAKLFDVVMLDESSILKALTGKIRKAVTDQFKQTKYRFCFTATPAPNDITEIANHAEFLGVMSRVDMLATFFVHDSDGDGWRLKKHAEEPFFRWLASWSISIRKPSDLGYSDEGYILPPLTVDPILVKYEYVPDGQLFNTGLKGITDRNKVRRGTMKARGEVLAELIQKDTDQWIVWCGFNEEAKLMEKLLPGAKQIEGSQSPDEKAALLEQFQNGEYRILITKTSIAGFGINLQNCHKQAFMGMNDSWEQYYQAIRRSYRFGQKETVKVYIALSELEKPVLENVQSKEIEALRLSQNLIKHVAQFEKQELQGKESDWSYKTADVASETYTLRLGETTERIKEIADNSVDLSIFSPPFMSLYTYSPTERDLGNSRNAAEFFEHFNFIIDELLRITAPGRLACVHVSQVPAMKQYDDYIGLKDFRGDVIRAFDARGWIYHGEVCIDKDPQAQAIRTKSKGLLFVSLEKDSSWLRQALADYILVFRKPGDNQKPITPLQNGEMTREDWIEWARPIWYGIKETNTLNAAEARGADDERHICPLQLGVIERCVKLWSNPGETIFDPFGGIGSTGYVAVKNKRKAALCELNPNYFEVMKKNMVSAAKEGVFQMGLFDAVAKVEVAA